MTQQQARDYVARWRWAERIAAGELRRASFEEKLRQTDTCYRTAYRTAVGLGLLTRLAAARCHGVHEVRNRWRRLKHTAM